MRIHRPVLFAIASAVGLSACGASTTPAVLSSIEPSDTVAIALPSAKPADDGTPAINTAPPTIRPTGTALPSATHTPAEYGAVPCNAARLMGDLTIPDGWETIPGTPFVKTWRIKNEGSCSWTDGYVLLFDHGDRMDAPDSVPFPAGTVDPGEALDVSVDLVAPSSIGTYQGFFKLRAADGTIFGIGENANIAFWVMITVLMPIPAPAVSPLTQVVAQTATAAPGGFVSAEAACPGGTVVSGGGFSVSHIDVQVYMERMSGNGWIAYGINDSAQSETLTAYAICWIDSSVRAEQTMSSHHIGGLEAFRIDAKCPTDSVVSGGGYGYRHAERDIMFLAGAYLFVDDWRVLIRSSQGTVVGGDAYAVCLSGAPLSVTPAFGSTLLEPGDDTYADAECPAGKAVSGGGWDFPEKLAVIGAYVDGSVWRVHARNTGAKQAIRLTAKAVCLAPK